MINLKINGMPVQVEEGTSILNATKKVNIKIPTLCYNPDLPPCFGVRSGSGRFTCHLPVGEPQQALMEVEVSEVIPPVDRKRTPVEAGGCFPGVLRHSSSHPVVQVSEVKQQDHP